MPPVVEELPNGLRVVTERFPHAKSVALGLWLIQGSRDEAESEGGMTHFCEHLLFKGTSNRHWREIATAINLMGGQFNAVTCTDWVKVYGHVIRKDLGDALTLIAEMFTDSLFPAEEVERERNVILEEIAMYEDIPDDLCQETFQQALMLPHPVGRPVIGTVESVGSFSRDRLANYWTRNLNPARMVLSIAGDLDEAECLRLATERLGHLTRGPIPASPLPPSAGASGQAVLNRDLEQINFAFGVLGPSRQSPDRFAWAAYDGILGSGMGSRLFDEVREKRGLAYGIGSSLNPLDHTGFLTISGSTRPESAALAIRVCLDEVAKLADSGPTGAEMETSIRQLERSHLLGMESLGLRTSLNGERLVHGIPYATSEEVVDRLHAITREEVVAAARQVQTSGPPAVCVVGPVRKAKGLKALLETLR
ncbi:insulinase family protein [bacterium]|nr:insulinase family protein [bacterium]